MAGEAYVANYSRGRLVLLGLASLGFVIGGLWMAGLFGEVPASRRLGPEMTQVVGWIAVLFFGLCGFVIVRQFMRGGVAFRIDASGIEHAQAVRQTFTWDEITRLQPVRMGNQPMVCYEVVQERIDQMTGIRAKLASANRSMTGCSFALAMSGTDAKMEEVVAALEQFAPDHLLVRK
ncbi:STM3941 family protein [Aurantiacibacter gilvus]|uniref:STM3941 family protein n=1 Tax=Aurantiacibacter gilvus TaxID=3139141 RepID=A0ABU9IDI8_9SPHN